MNNKTYYKKKKQILAVMWVATVCFVTGILYVAFIEPNYPDIYEAAPVAQIGENVHG
ncbi:hypothetical protein ACNPM2_03680 [Stenotrophomonas geniculata]|uniref:hypothetical protein n=1 Tax=Stenotrophomonas geniculata TaxID=86188 RepID=UPI003AAF4692